MNHLSSFLAGVLMLWGTLHVSGQAPEIGYINITSGGGKVYLSWQLLAGATCQGTAIHRSTDGKSFSVIGQIEGICGDLNKPVTYNFIDENPPLNQQIYYLLELGPGNFTEMVYTDLTDLDGNSYQIRPNPVTSISTLLFNNDLKEEHLLMVADITGKIIYSQSTRNDQFTIRAADFNSGILVFSIISVEGNKLISGKIMILGQ